MTWHLTLNMTTWHLYRCIQNGTLLPIQELVREPLASDDKSLVVAAAEWMWPGLVCVDAAAACCVWCLTSRHSGRSGSPYDNHFRYCILCLSRRPSRRRIYGLSEFLVTAVNPLRNIWPLPNFNIWSATIYLVKIQYIWPWTILMCNDGCWQMTWLIM